MVERGKHLIYCAGALAERYMGEGGSVIYAGKPYAPIYALAFEAVNRLAGEVPLRRIDTGFKGLFWLVTGQRISTAAARAIFARSRLRDLAHQHRG